MEPRGAKKAWNASAIVASRPASPWIWAATILAMGPLLAGCLASVDPADAGVQVPRPKLGAEWVTVRDRPDASDFRTSSTLAGNGTFLYFDGREHPVIWVEGHRETNVNTLGFAGPDCTRTLPFRIAYDPSRGVRRTATWISQSWEEASPDVCSGSPDSWTNMTMLELRPDVDVLSPLQGRTLRAGDVITEETLRPINWTGQLRPVTYRYEVEGVRDTPNGSEARVVMWRENTLWAFRDHTKVPDSRWVQRELWFRDGVPFPVRDDEGQRLVSYTPGERPIRWTAGAPGTVEPPRAPQASLEEVLPPVGDLGDRVPYGLRAAFENVEQDPTLAQYQVWRQQHPEAWLVTAWLAPYRENGMEGHRWVLVLRDGDAWIGVQSKRLRDPVLGGYIVRNERADPGFYFRGDTNVTRAEIAERPLVSLADAVSVARGTVVTEGNQVDYALWAVFKHSITGRTSPCWTVGDGVLADGGAPAFREVVGISAGTGWVTARGSWEETGSAPLDDPAIAGGCDQMGSTS